RIQQSDYCIQQHYQFDIALFKSEIAHLNKHVPIRTSLIGVRSQKSPGIIGYPFKEFRSKSFGLDSRNNSSPGLPIYPIQPLSEFPQISAKQSQLNLFDEGLQSLIGCLGKLCCKILSKLQFILRSTPESFYASSDKLSFEWREWFLYCHQMLKCH